MGKLFCMLLMSVVLATCSGCRYYCKNHLEQDYCCDGGKDYGHPAEHDGDCPEVRDTCTGVRAGFEAPDVCPHDGACSLDAKCCYDICLEHHTCKQALFSLFTIGPATVGPVTLPPKGHIANYARNGRRR